MLTALAIAAATLGGLHDARYCEVIELKGTPPDATAVVWNTIGLNECPADWWESLAVTGVALKNGPRHFLMDSVTASAGRVRTFDGQRLRRVATIPIRTAAELAQVPYTDRTIARTNVWHWKAGRVVYELVAPGGDVYVMQSYSQMVDSDQRIGDLRSLGKRIDPPPGWRFRVRRLRKPLDVAPQAGKATIIQDELLNTYQLAKLTRPAGQRKRRRVSLAGTTRLVSGSGGSVTDRGTVRGKPFGEGTIELTGSLAGGRLTAGFRLLFEDGSVIGTADMPFTIGGGEIDFAGTARFTWGTGAYRGITSGALDARDHNTLDGQSGELVVRGFARY
jgi:hypothetical protein